MPILKRHQGYCPLCEADTEFTIHGEWLREDYLCEQCRSTPRQRALIAALNNFAPNWKDELDIHESSPGSPSSDKLYREAANYTFSHYYPDLKSGEMGKMGAVCQNIENMSFPDNSFDIFITQDVMEHIYSPETAFREIARVLKPGGMHIFTAPTYSGLARSKCRAARREDGSIEYLEPQIYHGNPADPENGALVAWDWGMDLPKLIYRACGLPTRVILKKDVTMGIDGEMLEVYITRKIEHPAIFNYYYGVLRIWEQKTSAVCNVCRRCFRNSAAM